MSASTVWRITAFAFIAFALTSLAPATAPTGSSLPLQTDSAAAAGLMAPASTCPDLSASGNARNVARARQSMACLINYARRQKGLRKYRRHRKLDWSANRKSADVLRCPGFSHNACGRKFDHWIRRSGYVRPNRGWSTGENIAWGSGRLGNVRKIFNSWMHSAGHRQAILDRSFRDVGVGVSRGRMSGLKGSRVWVLHFGRIG